MIAVMVNGPKGGLRLNTGDTTETIVFSMLINPCHHQPNIPAMATLEYKKFAAAGNEALFKTDFDFDGHAYYCTVCEMDSRARYEAKEITKRLRRDFAETVRDSINHALNQWIGEDDEFREDDE